jgi:hypothetical protein
LQVARVSVSSRACRWDSSAWSRIGAKNVIHITPQGDNHQSADQADQLDGAVTVRQSRYL